MLHFYSCSTGSSVVEVPENLIGKWKSENTNITVRKTEGVLKYSFTSGSGGISINLMKDKPVSGSIGDYKFTNGKIVKSNIYKIVCNSVGSIFPNDPVPSKQISLWLFKVSGDTISGELRLTENGGKYPMADFVLIKE